VNYSSGEIKNMKRFKRIAIVAVLGLFLVSALASCCTYADSVRSARMDMTSPTSIVLRVGNGNTSWENDGIVMSSLVQQLSMEAGAQLMSTWKQGKAFVSTLIMPKPVTLGLQITGYTADIVVFPETDTMLQNTGIDTIRLDGGSVQLPRNYRLVIQSSGAVATIRIIRTDEYSIFPVICTDNDANITWEFDNWNFTGESQ
jgi:hypothetical protein